MEPRYGTSTQRNSVNHKYFGNLFTIGDIRRNNLRRRTKLKDRNFPLFLNSRRNYALRQNSFSFSARQISKYLNYRLRQKKGKKLSGTTLIEVQPDLSSFQNQDKIVPGNSRQGLKGFVPVNPLSEYSKSSNKASSITAVTKVSTEKNSKSNVISALTTMATTATTTTTTTATMTTTTTSTLSTTTSIVEATSTTTTVSTVLKSSEEPKETGRENMLEKQENSIDNHAIMNVPEFLEDTVTDIEISKELANFNISKLSREVWTELTNIFLNSSSIDDAHMKLTKFNQRLGVKGRKPGFPGFQFLTSLEFFLARLNKKQKHRIDDGKIPLIVDKSGKPLLSLPTSSASRLASIVVKQVSNLLPKASNESLREGKDIISIKDTPENRLTDEPVNHEGPKTNAESVIEQAKPTGPVHNMNNHFKLADYYDKNAMVKSTELSGSTNDTNLKHSKEFITEDTLKDTFEDNVASDDHDKVIENITPELKNKENIHDNKSEIIEKHMELSRQNHSRLLFTGDYDLNDEELLFFEEPDDLFGNSIAMKMVEINKVLLEDEANAMEEFNGNGIDFMHKTLTIETMADDIGHKKVKLMIMHQDEMMEEVIDPKAKLFDPKIELLQNEIELDNQNSSVDDCKYFCVVDKEDYETTNVSTQIDTLNNSTITESIENDIIATQITEYHPETITAMPIVTTSSNINEQIPLTSLQISAKNNSILANDELNIKTNFKFLSKLSDTTLNDIEVTTESPVTAQTNTELSSTHETTTTDFAIIENSTQNLISTSTPEVTIPFTTTTESTVNVIQTNRTKEEYPSNTDFNVDNTKTTSTTLKYEHPTIAHDDIPEDIFLNGKEFLVDRNVIDLYANAWEEHYNNHYDLKTIKDRETNRKLHNFIHFSSTLNRVSERFLNTGKIFF